MPSHALLSSPPTQPRRGGRLLRSILASALLCASAGCKTGPDLSADYAQTARENYELALGEFTDKDWEEAIQYADFVRIRFPFSRYAVESELLIARSEFEQGNYLTAQDAFRRFARLHPTHVHVRNGWASFMAAASAYMNAPQRRFFLLPPDEQLDQAPLHEALDELEQYFDHHTGSPTENFAKSLREDVLRRMLDHELYVARYYLERENTEAAIRRLEAAQQKYTGVGRNADVLFLLGLTYLRMDEIELARATFSKLLTQHPDHHHGEQARIYLDYVRKTYGPADPSRPRPDRARPLPESPPQPKNRAAAHAPQHAPPPQEAPTPASGSTEPEKPGVSPPTATPSEESTE